MYRVHYRDDSDPGCPTFTMRVEADDVDTAYEAFWDTCDGTDGWEIVKVERV